jgi:hypothetical protein
MSPCPSTHGGAGYVVGTYWDGTALICGLCGTRIDNPPPTGSREIYRSTAVWWKPWTWLRQEMIIVARWPDFIGEPLAQAREWCFCRCLHLNCKNVLAVGPNGSHQHYSHLPCPDRKPK